MRFEYIISLAIVAIFLASFIATSSITGMQVAPDNRGASLAAAKAGGATAQQQQAIAQQAAMQKRMQEEVAKRTAEQKKKSEALKKIMGGMKR